MLGIEFGSFVRAATPMLLDTEPTSPVRLTPPPQVDTSIRDIYLAVYKLE